MNKAPILPLGGFAAHTSTKGLLAPLLVITEMRQDLVVLVKQGDSSVQIGNQHNVPLHIDIGRKKESAKRLEMLPVHVKPLETLVRAIANSQLGCAIPGIQPLTMRGTKLAIRGTTTANGAKIAVL